MLVLAILGAGLCALLALNTATAASEVHQRKIDAANAALGDAEQQLARDIAAKQAPAELAREAAALGLIPADSPAFLRVNSNGSVTLLGGPAPATLPPAPPPATPKKKKTATTTATPTTKVTGTTTGKATGTPTGKPTGKPTGGTTTGTRSGTPTTTPTPTPTKTPTPTVTLPGGPR